MEKKIIKDLYCFLCSLQFDKKTIYDIHLKIIHNYASREESFFTENIQSFPQKVVKQIAPEKVVALKIPEKIGQGHF